MIQRSENDGIATLVITGEVGTEVDQELITMAGEILVGPGAKLILDLSGVNYINSTGINTLVRINAQANQQDQRVVFAAPTPMVEGVLHTTQLDRFFTVRSSMAEAVAELNS
jgi:anti-sigma B factor antagonist